MYIIVFVSCVKEAKLNSILKYQQNEKQKCEYSGVSVSYNSNSTSWQARISETIYIGTFDLASDAALASDKARQYNKSSTPATLNFATIDDYNKARSAELTSKGWTNSVVDMTVSSIEDIAEKRITAYAAKESKSKKKKSDSLGEEESTQKVSPKYGLLGDGEDHPNPNQVRQPEYLCRVKVNDEVCSTTTKIVISGTGRLGKATARAGGIKVCTNHSRVREVIKLAIEFHRKRKTEEEAANPRPKKKANSGGRKKKAKVAQEPAEDRRSSGREITVPTKFDPNHTKKASQSYLVTPPRSDSWTAATTTVESSAPDDTIIIIPQQDDLESDVQSDVPELLRQLFGNYMVCEKKSYHGLTHPSHTGMPLHSYGIMCRNCRVFKDSGIFLPSNMVLDKSFVNVENFNKMLLHLSKCTHFSNEEYNQLSDINIAGRTIVTGMNQYSEDSTLKSLQVVLCEVINDILINTTVMPPIAIVKGVAYSFKRNTKSEGNIGEPCIRGDELCVSFKNDVVCRYSKENDRFARICKDCRNHDDQTNHERRIKAFERRAKNIGRKFELGRDKFIELVEDDCEYCGKSKCGSIDRIDADGDYTDENCVSCCKVCNVDKGGKKLKEFKRRVYKRGKWIWEKYLRGDDEGDARAQFEEHVANQDYIPKLPVPRKKSISKKEKGNAYNIYQDGKFLLDLHFQHCALCGEIANGINRQDNMRGYDFPLCLEGCCSQDNESLANWDMYEFCVQTMKMYNHMFRSMSMNEGDIADILSEGEEYMTVRSPEIVGVGWTQRQPIKCTYTRLNTNEHVELLFPSSYTMGSLGFFKDGKEYTLTNFEYVEEPKEYNEWATNTTSGQLERIRSVLGIETNLGDSIDDILGE